MATPKRNEALHKAIIESGWKQYHIATLAGIDEHHLAHIKRGTGKATPEQQKRLAKVLKRSVEELFGNKEVAA